jgi:hypothetical protein
MAARAFLSPVEQPSVVVGERAVACILGLVKGHTISVPLDEVKAPDRHSSGMWKCGHEQENGLAPVMHCIADGEVFLQ